MGSKLRKKESRESPLLKGIIKRKEIAGGCLREKMKQIIRKWTSLMVLAKVPR